MADALDRDLRTDRLTFDELGWRGLWAYVTKAPPGTAIYHELSNGWTVGDEIALEQFNDQRELLWRYVAVNFEGGKDIPRPERIRRDDLTEQAPREPVKTWETVTVEELMTPEVRALLQG